MKKIILISLIAISPITNASIPLPRVIPDAQPGGYIVSGMRAQQDLRRQYIENQILQEQLAMMQQQRAMRERQLIKQQTKSKHQKYNAYR